MDLAELVVTAAAVFGAGMLIRRAIRKRSASRAAPPAPAAPPAAGAAFCPKCGTSVEANSSFCGTCGAPVQ